MEKIARRSEEEEEAVATFLSLVLASVLFCTGTVRKLRFSLFRAWGY